MRAVLPIAVMLTLVVAGDARACSCATVDPREALAQTDAAVIGTVGRSEAAGDRWITHIRVERAFKAELGEEVGVDTGNADGGGGDCTLKLDDGAHVGVFLGRRGTGWAGGLCSTVEPAALERAARPLPAPLRRGRVAVVAAIDLVGRTLAALDRRCRVLAYGAGRGAVRGLEVCPGARRLLELRARRVVVWRLPDCGGSARCACAPPRGCRSRAWTARRATCWR